MYEHKLVQFYTNLNLVVLDERIVSTTVGGVEIMLDSTRLEEILQVHVEGLKEYDWIRDENCTLIRKFTQWRVKTTPRKVKNGECNLFISCWLRLYTRGSFPVESITIR